MPLITIIEMFVSTPTEQNMVINFATNGPQIEKIKKKKKKKLKTAHSTSAFTILDEPTWRECEKRTFGERVTAHHEITMTRNTVFRMNLTYKTLTKITKAKKSLQWADSKDERIYDRFPGIWNHTNSRSEHRKHANSRRSNHSLAKFKKRQLLVIALPLQSSTWEKTRNNPTTMSSNKKRKSARSFAALARASPCLTCT